MTIQILNYNMKPVDVAFSTFPGGEEHVRIGDLQNSNVVRVEAKITSSSEFMRLVMLLDALNRMNVMWDLLIPYFPYARQDRVCNTGEAFSLEVASSILDSMYKVGCTYKVADVHSPVIKTLIYITETPTFQIISSWTKLHDTLKSGEYVLVAPDKGAVKRVSEVSVVLDVPFIQCDKVRDPATTKITGMSVPENLDPNVHYMIVDDICDGGRTFIEVAKAMKANGATKISLYVTHGIFSNGMGELSKYFESIWTTNSFHDRMLGTYNEMEIHFFDIFSIM